MRHTYYRKVERISTIWLAGSNVYVAVYDYLILADILLSLLDLDFQRQMDQAGNNL